MSITDIIPVTIPAPRDDEGQPVLNVDLLEKVYDHVKEHRDLWDQSGWTLLPETSSGVSDLRRGDGTLHGRPPCGTSHCVGGWAADLTGAKFTSGYDVLAPDAIPDDMIYDNQPEGPTIPVETYAREALGLTQWEANRLFFDTGTDLDELRTTIDEIKRGEYR